MKASFKIKVKIKTYNLIEHAFFLSFMVALFLIISSPSIFIFYASDFNFWVNIALIALSLFPDYIILIYLNSVNNKLTFLFKKIDNTLFNLNKKVAILEAEYDKSIKDETLYLNDFNELNNFLNPVNNKFKNKKAKRL